MIVERVRYLVGLATLAAALIGGVYLYDLLSADDTGDYFQINVEWRNARGLKPGGDVKYRGVVIGSVRDISLRDDGGKAVVALMIQPDRKHLVRTDSRFWIVTPRFAGLTGGATGLETLVRDSYIEFRSPAPNGPPMASGGSLLGMERPYFDEGDAPLEQVRRGDLVMELLATENHGLSVSSAVLFRGIRTGDVRSVDLAPDGSHIRIVLRIGRDFRRTITDKTRFWIARPRLSGALLRGSVSIEDVGALLSPFIGYHTPPGEGLPVPDDYSIAAELERPAFEMTKVAAERIEPRKTPGTDAPDGIVLVRVVYEAVEDDWFSPDDEVRREGTGVLLEDREGRLLVLTVRSLVDANYFLRDSFDTAPDIIKEGISVLLPDGSVQRALRSWVSPDGADLAVLAVELAAGNGEVAATPATRFSFEEGASAQTLQSLDGQRQPQTPLDLGAGLPPIVDRRGAAVIGEGRIVGLLGQKAGTEPQSVIVPIHALPEPLRPQ